MEGWRQRRRGSEPKTHLRKNKTVLTCTGLLMEGLEAFRKARGYVERRFPDAQIAGRDKKRSTECSGQVLNFTYGVTETFMRPVVQQH
jgi:hypothetical protein